MDKPEYIKVKTGPYASRINPDYDTPALRRVLADVHGLWDLPDTEIIRDSRSTRAGYVTIDLDDGPREVFFKQAKSRGLYYSVTRAFGSCRIFRGFDFGLALSKKGFPTPVPIAASLKRKLGTFQTAFYMAEPVKDAAIFNRFAGYDFRRLDRESRNRFLGALGETLARLHELDVEHGDMKSTNILVRRNKDGEFEVLFTDLEGAVSGQVGERGAARDLGRLAYNFPARGFPWTEALRVLRSYLAARPGFNATWRDLLWEAEREWRKFQKKYGK